MSQWKIVDAGSDVDEAEAVEKAESGRKKVKPDLVAPAQRYILILGLRRRK